MYVHILCCKEEEKNLIYSKICIYIHPSIHHISRCTCVCIHTASQQLSILLPSLFFFLPSFSCHLFLTLLIFFLPMVPPYISFPTLIFFHHFLDISFPFCSLISSNRGFSGILTLPWTTCCYPHVWLRLGSCTTEVSQQQSNLINTKLPKAFPTACITVPYYFLIVLHTEHWLTYIFVEPRPSQSVWEDHIWWRLTQVPSCCLLHWSGYHQT